MLDTYILNDKKIEIKSDLAAEFPVYIYLSEKKDYLLYSKGTIKPLKITSSKWSSSSTKYYL